MSDFRIDGGTVIGGFKVCRGAILGDLNDEKTTRLGDFKVERKPNFATSRLEGATASAVSGPISKKWQNK